MPIENRMALIRDATWREQHPAFDVEPEIVEWAKLHAQIWLKRWKEGTQESWTRSQERNNFIGLIGQKCFEVTLQQIEVPYIHNDPVIDWRGKKGYDFRIPNIETIEIKTVDYKQWQERLLVKCAEWHNSDYVLAVKLNDETPTTLQFIGYATKQEVNNTFHYAEKENPCPLKPCYWAFLTDLHPASEFFQMLKTKTENYWNTKTTEKEAT